MASSCCSAMVSQAVFLRPPSTNSKPIISRFPSSPTPLLVPLPLPYPSSLSLRTNTRDKPHAVSLSLPLSSTRSPIRAISQAPTPFKSSHNNTSTNPNPNAYHPLTIFFALAVAVVRKLSHSIPSITTFQSLGPMVGPAFFAAVRDRGQSAYLNTPLTVVAAGLAKWLDIYSGVLMVRVLLSWFPNIPWDRQPLSAIRDLCDPYLNLFRNIIPPVFDTLDVSPLLAFAVLGTLGSILNNSRGF